jgi:2,3,4,5-tetrahydropyridine-2-carboxylate N-succinyltransferase
MSNLELEKSIEAAWEIRDQITSSTAGDIRKSIEETLAALDMGVLRVAEKKNNGDWVVNQWAKKAVLLGFRIQDMEVQTGGPQNSTW